MWLVIGLSAFVTGWGLASNNPKAVLVGMTVALAAWVVDEDF
jgi:hypothetical protein